MVRPGRIALLAGQQRLGGGANSARWRGAGLADQERAHQAGMVLPPDAGELQRQLVVRVEPAAAGLVAAEQGRRARADDERVARIVAAALEDRVVHPRPG